MAGADSPRRVCASPREVGKPDKWPITFRSHETPIWEIDRPATKVSSSQVIA